MFSVQSSVFGVPCCWLSFSCHSVVIRLSFDGHSMVIRLSLNGHSVVIRLSLSGHLVWRGVGVDLADFRNGDAIASQSGIGAVNGFDKRHPFQMVPNRSPQSPCSVSMNDGEAQLTFQQCTVNGPVNKRYSIIDAVSDQIQFSRCESAGR